MSEIEERIKEFVEAADRFEAAAEKRETFAGESAHVLQAILMMTHALLLQLQLNLKEQ